MTIGNGSAVLQVNGTTGANSMYAAWIPLSGGGYILRVSDGSSVRDFQTGSFTFYRIVMYGGNGNDKLEAAKVSGIAGASPNAILAVSLEGGAANDTLYGSDFSEIFSGGSGNDLMYGSGNDEFNYGVDANDTMHGDDGNDTIDGEGGRDQMYGDSGDDVFYAGNDSRRSDTCTGGNGYDYYDVESYTSLNGGPIDFIVYANDDGVADMTHTTYVF